MRATKYGMVLLICAIVIAKSKAGTAVPGVCLAVHLGGENTTVRLLAYGLS